MSFGLTEPRLSRGRARERARGTGHPLQPLVGPARSAGTDSGWEDAAPLARREASAPTAAVTGGEPAAGSPYMSTALLGLIFRSFS